MKIFNESKNIRNQRKKLNMDYEFKSNYPKDFTYEQKKRADRWSEKAKNKSDKINYFTDKLEGALNKKFKSDLSLLSKVLKINKPLYIAIYVDMGKGGEKIDRIEFVITDNINNYHCGVGPLISDNLLHAAPNTLDSEPVQKWLVNNSMYNKDNFLDTDLSPESKKVLNNLKTKISSEFTRLMKVSGYFTKNYSVDTEINEEYKPTYFNY